MEFEVVDPNSFPAWDERILEHPKATVFHTAWWARVLAETYGYFPRYFVRATSSAIETVIPMLEIPRFPFGKRGVGLPFTDYCDPILGKGISLLEAEKSVISFGKIAGWSSVEFRMMESEMPQITSSQEFVSHVLDIKGPVEGIRRGLRDSTRRNIRKGEREGVSVVFSNNREAMETFYVLHCLTRKKHGLPPQPRRFFQNLLEPIIHRDSGVIAIGRQRGRPIAGSIFLHSGKRAVFKFGASDHRWVGTRANNLVMWKAIEWYSARDYESFCFGRTELANKGLRQFKGGWGAREGEIRYYKYDLRRDVIVRNASRFPVLQKIFRKMPVFLSRAIGEKTYRYLG